MKLPEKSIFPASFVLCLSLCIPTACADLPRLQIEDFEYIGAFRIPADDFGSSSANYSRAILAYNPDSHSLFLSGHEEQNSIAEFYIPELVNSENINDLNFSPAPKQSFVNVLDKKPINYDIGLRVSGMLYLDGKLIINTFEFYDNYPYQTKSTLIANNANNLAESTYDGYLEMQGAARASGWISNVPLQWQSQLGYQQISGFSSGNSRSIISRFSVGPSAFLFDGQSLIDNGSNDATNQIPTHEVLGYSLDNPLVPVDDLENNSGTNRLWTHLSEAAYGFIVPGTSTYAVFGFSGGHESGISYGDPPYGGYKGYYTHDPDDQYSYYWLYDVRDLVKAKNGEIQPWEIRPYDQGKFITPFQSRTQYISGGTYDTTHGVLYLSIYQADTEQSQYTNPPVIVAYRIASTNIDSNNNGDGSGNTGNTNQAQRPSSPDNLNITIATPNYKGP